MRIALLDSAPPGEAALGRLAAGLVARGHEVTVMHGSDWREAPVQGAELRALWRPPRLPAQRFYEDDLGLAPAAIWRLARGRFDLAHAFAPALGWAAAKARRFGGPPFAYSHGGELTRAWLVDRHYRIEMLLATAAAASVCFAQDDATADGFRRYLLREPVVIDPGVDAAAYEAAYESGGSA